MSILRVQSVALIYQRMRVDWERVAQRSNITFSCSSFLPLILMLRASGQADGVQNVSVRDKEQVGYETSRASTSHDRANVQEPLNYQPSRTRETAEIAQKTGTYAHLEVRNVRSIMADLKR